MKKFIPLYFLIFSISFGQIKNIPARGKTNKQAKINLVESSHSGAVPRKISYQGILTKDNGQPADETFYNVKFRLYEMLEGGDYFLEESLV